MGGRRFRIRARWTLTALAGVLFAGGGCSCLMAKTGDMMAGYATEHLNPYMMELGDLGMACQLGQSVGGQLLSFERITDKPALAGVPTMASAATCAEMEAWAHEIDSLRAIKRGDGPGAKDARIAEKRKHYVAAWRYHKSYEYLVDAFGEIGGKCPDFDNDAERLVFMLGNIAAVQAVQHDRAVGGRVGVPLDVPRKAARAIRCLNNETWWGVPAALEAAVWSALPGAAPDGVDPWAQMKAAATAGREQGVRLAIAVWAQAAAAGGRTDDVRAAIRLFAESGKSKAAPKRWRLLDKQAEAQLLALSDRLWTEGVGHRTPEGALGTFWDDVDEADEDDDDMLDDLGDEAEDTPATPAEQAPAAAAGNG